MVDVGYPSEEVARHAAGEAVKRSPCLIVLAVGWESHDAMRLIRCGDLPADVRGEILVAATMMIDRMMRLEGGR